MSPLPGSTEASAPFEDRTLRSRYELKYLIHEQVAARLEQHIAPMMVLDRYSAARMDGYYPIVSLYLDSPDLRLYRQSADGVALRFKLRVRSYSDAPSSPCFLEIKERVNAIVAKRRARIAHAEVPRRLSGLGPAPRPDDVLDRDGRTFAHYRAAIAARPVALIRYRRKAYEVEGAHRVRITFDRDLTYSPWQQPTVPLDGPRWESARLGRVILEVKFTGRFPLWLSRLAREFELMAQSVSKYGLSLQHSGLIGHLAPRRVG